MISRKHPWSIDNPSSESVIEFISGVERKNNLDGLPSIRRDVDAVIQPDRWEIEASGRVRDIGRAVDVNNRIKRHEVVFKPTRVY